MGIEWRTVAGFPAYKVSSEGDIIRIARDRNNHRLSGRPLKPSANKAGYLSLSLCDDGRKTTARVNRIVCEAFHGPAPHPDCHAAHLDGVRANNRADNLAWKMPADNEADKVVHGTALIGDRHWSKRFPQCRARGERHGLAKLSPDAVRAIRADGRFQRVIAADYGVSQKAVWSIKAGVTWGHVE